MCSALAGASYNAAQLRVLLLSHAQHQRGGLVVCEGKFSKLLHARELPTSCQTQGARCALRLISLNVAGNSTGADNEHWR
jgi:hypothetical protein